MTDEPTADVPAARGAGTTAGAAGPGGSLGTGSAPPHADRDGRTGPGPDARTSVLQVAPSAAAGTAPGAPGVPTTPPVGAGSPDGATAGVDAPAVPPAPPARRRRRWPVVLLTLALLAALGAAGYLLATTRAYAERLEWTEAQARQIGTDLTITRGELDGARGEIAGLQAQLTTAQERITALADEKAQIGDDREAQRQLLDYQARVSEAAGIVASALDRCVQGQDQLIAYLEDAASYDPAELTQYGADVEALCRSASEANEALQSELVDP